MQLNRIYEGDSLNLLKQLDDDCIDMVMTSPPYWSLRDYGVKGQIGLESTLDEFVEKLLRITSELKRVLKQTGVVFWNHGDCYGGGMNFTHSSSKNGNRPLREVKSRNKAGQTRKNVFIKCLTLQNYRLILRMIDEQGWILRNAIIWHKPNPMPSSAKDRFTNSYEPVFILVKNKKYWFDLDAVKTPSINKNKDLRPNKACKIPGDVWHILKKPFPEAHIATYPEELCICPIKSGCPEGGVVLDPFAGAGTTCLVAMKLNRNYLGFELNPDYVQLAKERIAQAKKAL